MSASRTIVCLYCGKAVTSYRNKGSEIERVHTHKGLTAKPCVASRKPVRLVAGESNSNFKPLNDDQSTLPPISEEYKRDSLSKPVIGYVLCPDTLTG